MMRTQTLLVLSVSALALLAAPAQAERGRNPLAGQPAIRHRVELRKLRFEVSPQFLLSLNQPYLIGLGGGANVQFHITDWIGIGASFHYTGHVLAPLSNSIVSALPETPPSRAVDMSGNPTDPRAALRQPSQGQFKDHLIGPDMLIGLYAALTPFGGKFSLFNALFAHYDFYLIGGIGIVNLGTPASTGPAVVSRSEDLKAGTCASSPIVTGGDVNFQCPDQLTGIRFAGLLGIGVHIFFNEWIGLQLEVRDYLYKSNPGGLDVDTTDGPSQGGKKLGDLTGSDEYITSNLYFGLGLSIMLPPRAKISR